MPVCPNGHDSDSDDYCDECGLKLAAAPSAVAEKAVAEKSVVQPAGQPCPHCGMPRSGRYCEVCGYDFSADAPVSPPTASPPLVTVTDGQGQATAWSAVATADRAYYESVRTQGGPDATTIAFPPYCPARQFTLTGEYVRIGRRSASRGINPEIDLTGPPTDPGVSHLHAVLLAQPDGTWAIVDPGSANGTTINDATEPVQTNHVTPLHDGDRIHVGAWTTIHLSAPPPE